MKKCFTLILLLAVAMLVAGVIPAGATAPNVRDLPRVVIGSTNILDEAFDIDNYVDWYGQFETGAQTINFGIDPWQADEGFHVYLADTAGPLTAVAARNMAGAQIMQLTAPDVTSLQLQGLLDGDNIDPMMPIVNEPAKNVWWGYDAAPHWMSLQNLTLTAGTTKDVAVAALVSSDVTTGGAKWLEITKSATANKVQFGKDYSSFGFVDFAEWSGRGQSADYGAAIVFTSGTKQIGFNANTTNHSSKFYYGLWQVVDGDLTAIIPCHGGIGIAQPVFEVKALMANETDQTALDYCPGWRMLALNASQSHMAAVLAMNLITGTTGANGPYAGNEYRSIGRLYFEPPFDTAQMEDGGQVSLWQALDTSVDPPLVNAVDGRDYAIQWEMVDLPGDRGIFTLRSFSIRTFDAAQDFVFSGATSWTGATIANWDLRTADYWDLPGMEGVLFPGMCQGSLGVHHHVEGGPDAIDGAALDNALRLWAHDPKWENSNVARPRLQMATMDNSVQANRRQISANKLMRVSVKCGSGSVENGVSAADAQDAAPLFRLFLSTNRWTAGVGGVPVNRWINWYEVYGGVGPAFKTPNARPIDPVTGLFTRGNPGVPKAYNGAAGGSTVHLYLFTHKLAPKVMGLDPLNIEYLQPELQVYSMGMHFTEPFNPNTWPDERSFLEFREVKMEDVATVSTMEPIWESSGPQILETFFNGGFEAPVLATNDFKYWSNWGGVIPSWTCTGAALLSNGTSAWGRTNHEGAQMAGVQDAGSLSQVLTELIVGKTYTVAWAEAARDGAPLYRNLTVTAGAATVSATHPVNAPVGGNQAIAWTHRSGSFVATTASVTLTFTVGAGDSNAVFIDDVIITWQ